MKKTNETTYCKDVVNTAAKEALKAFQALRNEVELLIDDREDQLRLHKALADVEFYLQAIRVDTTEYTNEEYNSDPVYKDLVTY